MAGYWRWALVVAALLIGVLAFACGGGDDNGDGDKNGDEPTAEATAEDGNGNGDTTPEATAEDGNGDGEDEGDGNGGVEAGGDAFDGVPLPDGAKEIDSATMSGSDIPMFAPSDAGIDAAEFDEVTMKSYEVDSSPEDVGNFYKDNRGDWDDAFSLYSSDGGFAIWTQEGKVAWISVSESSDTEGGTELIIFYGEG